MFRYLDVLLLLSVAALLRGLVGGWLGAFATVFLVE